VTMGAEESMLRSTPLALTDQDVDFATWVGPHTAVLAAVAIREVGSAAAEDVVQDALVRAWRRRSTYRADRGSVRSWLVAVLLDQARRHRTRRPSLPVVVDPAQQLSAGTAERLTLEAAIATLPRRQRQVVTLHYLADLPVTEIATLLDIATGSVKSALHDARSALRRQLEESP
jgi:RNA polymerase sigma factor (sigma-70 family)